MERLKQVYLSSVLTETFWLISDLQEQAVSEWGLFASGRLKSKLGKHFSLKADGGAGQLSFSVLNYARFLDMKDKRRRINREGFHLYNRIVWGVVYNRTLPALRTGFTDELRAEVLNQLRKSGKSIEDGANREFAMDLKQNFFKYKF